MLSEMPDAQFLEDVRTLNEAHRNEQARAVAADKLIRRMADCLASFQMKNRGGLYHIGRDMELCRYGGYFGPGGPSKCSPQCVEVRECLEEAGEHLGLDVNAFRKVGIRRIKKRESR